MRDTDQHNRRRPRFGWISGLLGQAVLTAASVAIFAALLQISGGAAVMTAHLAAPNSPSAYLARVEDGQLTVSRSAGTDKAYHLWIIQPNATPQALGQIQDTITLPAPQDITNSILAITETADPNSPLIASGKFDTP